MHATSFRIQLVDQGFDLTPAGCIHWPHTNKTLLSSLLDDLKAGSYTILMGDSFDFARTHYRKHLRGYQEDLNSPEALDQWVRNEVQALADKLKPYSSQIIGCILGNHLWTFLDGTNSEQYLCQLLGIRYLGPQAVVRLDLFDSDSRRESLVLYAHHHGGSMGGKSAGGDMNALLKQEAIIDADIYCLGHTHDTYGKLVPKFAVTTKGQPQLLTRTRAFLRTGCFYQPASPAPTAHNAHHASYPAQAGYGPKHQGYVTLTTHLSTQGNSKIPVMSLRF